MLQAGSNCLINDCKATKCVKYFVLIIYYFNFAMKKINLKGISEILSEKELKNVMGGSGTTSGTCGWHYGSYTMCGWDKSTVLSYYNSYGGNWCCDSCGSSSYCG